MKTRFAVTAATVVSLAACAQTPTAPLADQVPAGPSFDNGGSGGFIRSGTYLEDDGETTTMSTVQGDSTGRNPFALGSGS
jgi:hypothetical protein